MELPAQTYQARIKRVIANLKKRDGHAILAVSAPPPTIRSRDGHYPYRPNSDFFYLTGSTSSGATLVISSRDGAHLLCPKPDPVKIVWEGAGENLPRLARSIGATAITTTNVAQELKKSVRGHDEYFYHPIQDTPSFALAQELVRLPSHTRCGLPRGILLLDCILEPMRLIKDAREVAAIEDATAVTFAALASIQPLLRAKTSERTIAAALEFAFRSQGASCAFNSIVGSGVSAATLHYEKLSRTLKEQELCLIDCGAELHGYAADVTRVFPVGGRFTPIHRHIYEIVLASQNAAIRAVRPGVSMGAVYNAAARVLTEGLVALKVLRGRPTSLLKQGAYKPYFPHGIGHTLGLDVHDVGNLRGNNAAVLAPGMVITIEPGLYFPKPVGAVPACGVRIEDDVLVTRSGARVLTAKIPKAVAEIES